MNITASSFRRQWWQFPLAAIFAFGLTVLTYFIVTFVTLPGDYVRVLFFERSWIQHTNTFVFWLVAANLMADQLSFRVEAKALRKARAVLSHADLARALIWSDARIVKEKLEAEPARLSRSIVFSRLLNAMARLLKNQSASELDTFFRNRSDLDSARLDTSYAGIRYFIWLIPTLGFIGTVMGIGQGITGFAAVLMEATSFEKVKEALPIATGQLGTAFDTTFLALILTVVATCHAAFLQKKQEHMLQEIDVLCLDEVCGMFQDHTSQYETLIKAIEENVAQIKTSMAGNRGSVEKILRQELPAAIGQHVGASLEGPLNALATRLASQLQEQQAQNAQLFQELRVALKELGDQNTRGQT